jgi:hypothetical protein
MKKSKTLVCWLIFTLCFVASGSASAEIVVNKKNIPLQDQSAFWVDSSVCTVVVKTSIDTTKGIQVGATPFDSLTSLPAICISNVGGQTLVPNGVRYLMSMGFRIKSVSHTSTSLSNMDNKVELLLSALFALERPQTIDPNTKAAAR